MLEAVKSDNADMRFFAAATLLSINQEDVVGHMQTMKSLLLDSWLMPDFRRSAAFRLTSKAWAELAALLRHSDFVVR